MTAAATSSGRQAGPRTIARQLRAALAKLETEQPTAAAIRQAHELATKALTNLESAVARLAQADADGHRQHAIKQAKLKKDARGYRRPPATMPGYHIGRPNPNKGKKFPATPPSDNEVVQMYAVSPTISMVTRGKCPSCGQGEHLREHHLATCVNAASERRRALLLLCWRTGLRIGCEALKLQETDLYPEDGYVYVAKGKNGKARMVGVDDWIWQYLTPWLQIRQTYPTGPLFCVLEGPTAGVRAWDAPGFRRDLHALARAAGVRRRVAPHQLRHAAASGQREDGIDTLDVSRNLGHSSLAVTEIYFRGIPHSQTIQAIRGRPMPRISMLDVLRNGGVKAPEQAAGVVAPDLMGVLAAAQAKGGAARGRLTAVGQLVGAP